MKKLLNYLGVKMLILLIGTHCYAAVDLETWGYSPESYEVTIVRGESKFYKLCGADPVKHFSQKGIQNDAQLMTLEANRKFNLKSDGAVMCMGQDAAADVSMDHQAASDCDKSQDTGMTRMVVEAECIFAKSSSF